MVDTPTIFRAAQRAALLEELDELLAEGHERGYLTSDRLESALQEVELSPEQLEELFAAQEVGLAKRIERHDMDAKRGRGAKGEIKRGAVLPAAAGKLDRMTRARTSTRERRERHSPSTMSSSQRDWTTLVSRAGRAMVRPISEMSTT